MVSQNSPAALQRQMQHVRGNLSEHADEAVQKARRGLDWRHYVARHPWTALGVAAAAGYILVPRRAFRAGNSEAVTEAVDRVARAVQPSPLAGVVAGMLSAVTTTLAREVTAWVTASLSEFLASRGKSPARTPVERLE